MKAVLIDYTLHRPVRLRARFEVRGFTVLLGCSGAGKTSLLRALTGLLPAVGTPWNGLPPQARAVGYLPQEALLFPHLSVLENVAYALRGPERLTKARALLIDLGLEELAEREPSQLSGGQAKRIALARALAREVDLLLLDEPSSGLDMLTQDKMLAWLCAASRARGVPVLAATHDHQIAAQADQVVLLAQGNVIQSGPPREVFSAPVSRAAAELLGYDNVFECGGAWWAIRSGAIVEAAEGKVFTIQQVRDTGAGLFLSCGPAPSLRVVLPHGYMQDYPLGAQIRLNLQAAVRVD